MKNGNTQRPGWSIAITAHFELPFFSFIIANSSFRVGLLGTRTIWQLRDNGDNAQYNIFKSSGVWMQICQSHQPTNTPTPISLPQNEQNETIAIIVIKFI